MLPSRVTSMVNSAIISEPQFIFLYKEIHKLNFQSVDSVWLMENWINRWKIEFTDLFAPNISLRLSSTRRVFPPVAQIWSIASLWLPGYIYLTVRAWVLGTDCDVTGDDGRDVGRAVTWRRHPAGAVWRLWEMGNLTELQRGDFVQSELKVLSSGLSC